jgi:hypothetical protein
LPKVQLSLTGGDGVELEGRASQVGCSSDGGASHFSAAMPLSFQERQSYEDTQQQCPRNHPSPDGRLGIPLASHFADPGC